MLCPPLDIEGVCTYFTYRQLAIRLAGDGIAVVRFDYDGTGDSAGSSSDPGRVTAWLRSVGDATEVIRGHGEMPLCLVGMRVGALLAAFEAARRGDVEALVLWDPCLSGRAYVREQRLFHRVGLDAGPLRRPGFELSGLQLDPGTATDLSRLRLADLPPRLAAHHLVLTHPHRPTPEDLEAHFAGVGAEWGRAVGQSELLDPPLQTPPEATIDLVSEWLSSKLASPPPIRLRSLPARTEAVIRGDGGEPVATERFTRLGEEGRGLFGIVTEPLGGAGSSSTTVLFVNEGNTPHIGQARLWVDLARAWAARGVRSVRWDLAGNGDSDARPGTEPHAHYLPGYIEDVATARRSVSPADASEVVMVGLCAGAYHSLEAALREPARGVAVINPAFSFATRFDRGASGGVARRARTVTRRWVVTLAGPAVRGIARRAGQDVGRWQRSLETGTWPASLAHRFPAIPEPAWRLVTAIALVHPPAEVLERVVGSGTELIVICGRLDLRPIALGGRHVLGRLSTDRRFQLDLLPGLDHSTLVADQRREMIEHLTRWVVPRCAPDVSSDAVGPPGGQHHDSRQVTVATAATGGRGRRQT